MAKLVRNAVYELKGRSGSAGKLKYVDKYTFAKDTFRVFRQLRPKSVKRGR